MTLPNQTKCFIFGLQRSGSTLLHNIFKLHPDVYGTPNDLNLLDVSRKLFRIVSNGKQLRKMKEWQLEEFKDILNLLLSCRDDNYLFRELFELYFKGRSESILVHKNPKAEFELTLYRKIFPDSKFVFCIRNPIAIMASKKYWIENKKSWNQKENQDFDDILDLMKHMSKQMEVIYESFKIIDSVYEDEDVLGVVDYDRLIQETKFELKPIFSQLGIKLNLILEPMSKMRRPYTSYSENSKKVGMYNSSMIKWKTKLTKFEIDLIFNSMLKFVSEYKFKSEMIERTFNKYITSVKVITNKLEV